MKKIIALLILVSFLFSCNRALTPYQAASGHYKKCRDIK